jgi:nuclear transport factor 2 (NTF2) superfamily protein
VAKYLLFKEINMTELERPPLPPFSYDDALIKVRKAEDAWNGKQPKLVAMAYTSDSRWRNRAEFINGRAQIVEFLTHKWEKEHEYRLIKELWAQAGNRIAVRFAYEWHDKEGNWFRSYGNENWEFDDKGYMASRHASINDMSIDESERKLRWEGSVRPDDSPSLSELGL